MAEENDDEKRDTSEPTEEASQTAAEEQDAEQGDTASAQGVADDGPTETPESEADDDGKKEPHADVSAHAAESTAADQDEIDALMGDDDDDDEPVNQQNNDAVDENDPLTMFMTSRAVGENLPMLDVIFEQLTRNLSDTIRALVSELADVEYTGIQNLTFGEYRKRVSFPALIAVINLEEWNEQALIHADAKLVYSIVGMMLGGRHAPPDKTEGRPYTRVERKLMGEFLERVLSELSRAFDAVAPVTFKLERFEDDPIFAPITQDTNATIWASIDIELRSEKGKLNFIIPHGSLEPIRDRLTQITRVSPGGADRIWQDHFRNEAENSEYTVTAEIERAPVPAREILNWHPGCVLELDTKADDPIDILVNGWTFARGRMATYDRRYAVTLTGENDGTHHES